MEVKVRRLTVADLLELEAAQEAIAAGKIAPVVAFLERAAEVQRDGAPVSVRELYVDELQQVIQAITKALMPGNSASG